MGLPPDFEKSSYLLPVITMLDQLAWVGLGLDEHSIRPYLCPWISV
jgi:hypothetical protein